MILTAGGLEHGGGIGRMIGYMLDAWPKANRRRKPVVVDTRGPPRRATWILYFALAVVRLCVEGLTRRPLVYIHVAGRGSTLRKAILVAVAKLLQLPLVLHLHDFDYQQFLSTLPRFALALVSWVFQAADAVVVLGQTDRQTVTRTLGVSRDAVVVVANCVPAPMTKLGTGAADGPLQILFLGDPSRRKGVHDLLAALAHPHLSDGPGLPDWRAVIAGGGGEVAGFREETRARGLDHRVSLPGWMNQADVQKLLSAADVLVLPSYGEGMAMSVLEAMSFGLCVVCTPVGALAEVIEDGVSGLLVQPGDVEGLAKALRRTLDDPDLRRRLGEGARSRYRAGYDVRAYPERICAVFDLALARHAAPTLALQRQGPQR